MLERKSALAGVEPIEAPGLRLAESPQFSLLQIDSPSKAAFGILGKLPAQVGIAIAQDVKTVMKIGPDRFWLIGQEQSGLQRELQGKAILTPLSHGRTRLLLEGPMARSVLARSAALDFHANSFGNQAFAMTGIHHTPVLIHCIGADSFHVYALRTFALSVWEWLADVREGLG